MCVCVREREREGEREREREKRGWRNEHARMCFRARVCVEGARTFHNISNLSLYLRFLFAFYSFTGSIHGIKRIIIYIIIIMLQ